MRDILQPLCRAWIGILQKAHDIKRETFGKDADECRRFLDGPYDWMYTGEHDGGAFKLVGQDNIPRPSFRMTANKVADVVQLYGPALYSRNPHRTVSPKVLSELPFDLMVPPGAPPDHPLIAQRIEQIRFMDERKQRVREATAGVLEDLLNVTPNELDLEWHSRQAIDEALVTGLGLMWIEPFRPPNSPMLFIGSFYDTCDNLLIDPDMETWKNALWIARRCIEPRHKVEKKYGLKKGSLRGTLESSKMQGVTESSTSYDYFRKRGETTDLCVYWKIYSRMGIGHHLNQNFDRRMAATSSTLEKLGDHCFLVVSDEYPEFLNLHSGTAKLSIEGVREAIAWPTPFWKDPTDPWPCSRFVFHENARRPWPSSHVKFALGELKFMNWTLSFLADKVKNTSRDFLAIAKGVSEELKDAVLSGKDLTLLDVEKSMGSIDQVVQFLQHPPFNKDILQVFEMMRSEWEQRTGLSMLMYGESSRQMRSSAEAQYKSGQMRVRPDDMARKVEEAATLTARKEMIAAYWHYRPEHVLPMLGEERTQLYIQTVMSQSLDTIVHELDVRIEAGSIRKPNREREIANANTGVQVWQGVLTTYAQMTGDFGPINWLANKWAKANDMEHGFVMRPPPPPQPDETALRQAEMEMAAQQQLHEQELRHKEEDHALKVREKITDASLKGTLDRLLGEQKMELSSLEGRQGLAMELQKHIADLAMDEETHEQELRQDSEQHSADLAAAKAMARAKPKPSSNGNGKKKSGA